MPKLSVIVPIYNVQPYIEECLDSLVKQTLKDIEIICVDDCGTDKSMDIVQKFAEQDARIKIVHNKKNSGLSISRNNGMRVAESEFLMFCDSDDWFSHDMCEKMLNAIIADDADMGMCGMEIIYESDHDKKASDDEYFKIKYSGTMENNREIMKSLAVCSCAKIYRRDIIQKHNIEFPKGLKHEDEFFFRAYGAWVNKIAFVPEGLYKYRRRAGSIMNNAFANLDMLKPDILYIAIEYFKYAKKHNLLAGQMKCFWCDTFIPLFNSAIKYNTAKHKKTIYDIAIKFIDEYYVEQDVDFYTQCAIKMIQKRQMPIKKYMWGILRIRTTPEKRKFILLGIEIWKTVKRKKRDKYYLFGIRML